MTDRPAPTRRDHQCFCEIEGWVEVRNARNKIGHHHTYELTLPNGEVYRTRISHPPNRDTYGPSIWSHILRDQLQVTEDEFWDFVKDDKVPVRGRPEPTRPAIPVGIVAQLIKNGVAESEIAAMTKEQAIERATAFWSQQP